MSAAIRGWPVLAISLAGDQIYSSVPASFSQNLLPTRAPLCMPAYSTPFHPCTPPDSRQGSFIVCQIQISPSTIPTMLPFSKTTFKHSRNQDGRGRRQVQNRQATTESLTCRQRASWWDNIPALFFFIRQARRKNLGVFLNLHIQCKLEQI